MNSQPDDDEDISMTASISEELSETINSFQEFTPMRTVDLHQAVVQSFELMQKMLKIIKKLEVSNHDLQKRVSCLDNLLSPRSKKFKRYTREGASGDEEIQSSPESGNRKAASVKSRKKAQSDGRGRSTSESELVSSPAGPKRGDSVQRKSSSTKKKSIRAKTKMLKVRLKMLSKSQTAKSPRFRLLRNASKQRSPEVRVRARRMAAKDVTEDENVQETDDSCTDIGTDDNASKDEQQNVSSNQEDQAVSNDNVEEHNASVSASDCSEGTSDGSSVIVKRKLDFDSDERPAKKAKYADSEINLKDMKNLKVSCVDVKYICHTYNKMKDGMKNGKDHFCIMTNSPKEHTEVLKLAELSQFNVRKLPTKTVTSKKTMILYRTSETVIPTIDELAQFIHSLENGKNGGKQLRTSESLSSSDEEFLTPEANTSDDDTSSTQESSSTSDSETATTSVST